MAKKKLKKAILAGLTAYAASKMMAKGPTDYEYEASQIKKPFQHDLEAVAPKKLKGHPGGWNQESGTFSSPPMTLKRKAKLWWEKLQGGNPYKKATGGSISASAWKKHGGVIKTEHARLGKMIKAAQGTYAKEDESLGMRLGKGKGTAKERDMSYGKWGNRSKDWKTAKTGSMIKAKHGTMVTGGTAYVKTKLNGTLKVKTF